jgi:hypothetical protein
MISLGIIGGGIFFSEQCFGEVKCGDLFRVKRGCYVPLFSVSEAAMDYEIGEGGNSCHNLDTVLWEGSVLRIIGIEKNENVEVEFFLTEKARGEGFVHRDFFEKSMEPSCEAEWRYALYRNVYPLSLEKIKKVFQRCVDENVPYCYGANNFATIDIKQMYEFKLKNSGDAHKSYELRGFDSSGLLHFISGGNLPHCTYGLDREAQTIFTFDTRKKYSVEEKRMVLSMLNDSDYLMLRHNKDRFNRGENNSVLVVFNRGFLEFRNPNEGLVYTKKKDAFERLECLLREGSKKGSNVIIIRWHPELLGQPTGH